MNDLTDVKLLSKLIKPYYNKLDGITLSYIEKKIKKNIKLVAYLINNKTFLYDTLEYELNDENTFGSNFKIINLKDYFLKEKIKAIRKHIYL